MKRPLGATAFAAFFLLADAAAGAEQTVSLAVQYMDCDLCPIVVHKALAGVEGVTAVQVEYRRERATVTYDDEKTSTAALIEVLTNVGYPARVVP